MTSSLPSCATPDGKPLETEINLQENSAIIRLLAMALCAVEDWWLCGQVSLISVSTILNSIETIIPLSFLREYRIIQAVFCISSASTQDSFCPNSLKVDHSLEGFFLLQN